MNSKRATKQTPAEKKYGPLVVNRQLWLRAKAVAEREDRSLTAVAERAISDYIARSDAAALVAHIQPAPEAA